MTPPVTSASPLPDESIAHLLPTPSWMSSTWYVVNRTPFGDFTEPLEDMMIAYLKANWSAQVTPYISTNPPYDFKDKVRFGDFPYDYYATYYVRVKEDDTDFNNDLVLDNTYQMRTALNIDISARRLRYGENFAELNNMRLEIMRILGIYRPDNISGVHMITMDLPGERDIEQQVFDAAANRTIWYVRIKCWLHYMKAYSCVLEPEPEPEPEVNIPQLYLPMYIWPTLSEYDDLAALKTAYPDIDIVVTINPNNGDFSDRNPDFVTGITKLNNAGVKMIGYVYTQYGNRDISAVQNCVDNYRTYYPEIAYGIFLDEMTNITGKEQYYTDITAYVKNQGMQFVLGNPGNATTAEYLDTVDSVLVYEQEGAPDLATVQTLTNNGEPSASKYGIISYNTAAVDQSYIDSIRPFVGLYYQTDDGLPNPWDSLPSYLEELIQALLQV